MKRRGAHSNGGPSEYMRGYGDGYDTGYNHGFDVGFNQGADQFHKPFTGTSIIIPTFNQQKLLQACIESIYAHTSPPYELIIVDNGSTDSTPQYLKSLPGRVRIHTNATNLGFAGGVNQGLRMARGTTLLILNNDTIVTAKWLDILLHCVWSDPRVGLVGPVTNFISGGQLVNLPFDGMQEMHAAARSFNKQKADLWRETDRLTGFCLLMRRETFEKIGFFDEGYAIGNFEDDDYCMRARLLGYKLVIAGNTFIYHAGNATMNQFGEQVAHFTRDNESYFNSKWPHAQRMLEETSPYSAVSPLKAVDLYASHVAVKGSGEQVYWIEQNARHPVAPQRDMPVTRISQRDLWLWGKRNADFDLHGRQSSLCTPPAEDGTLAEGVLVHTPDYEVYQFVRGRLRRLSGSTVMKAWQLDRRPVFPIGWETRNQYPSGIPIAAPPVLKSGNI